MAKYTTRTAYYSNKTGLRVNDAYGKRNPTKVTEATVAPDFLRGTKITIDADGMPSNICAAREAVLVWGNHQVKLEARRAKAKAKKLKAKVVKKTIRKKAVKKVLPATPAVIL
ncbi:hypothetical protein LUCX_89 [Xanthomonas phage vB_XciM_LucasX]|nr:hypothetical protein LUCX_89 [Xanthomonas phage vB_XciM_LucasX]